MVVSPDRCAAIDFSLMPPIGSTRPRNVISPVIPTKWLTGTPLKAEIMAIAIVTRLMVRLSGWHLPGHGYEYRFL